MIIRLQQPIFEYDDVTNELIITLMETAPIDSPDPASWEAEFVRVIRIPLPTSPAREPKGS